MRGFFYLILTGFFLGTIGIWAKLIASDISPFLLTIFRTMIAAAFILVLIVLSRNIKTAENLRIRKKDVIPFLIASFFGVAIGLGFYIKSFSYVPVANAVVLVYVYPVVTAFLSFVFLREKITRWEIAALILILAGVWSIYGPEINIASDATGNMFAIVAGLGYSVFIVSMRYFEEKGYKYWNVTFWPLVLGGMMLILFMPFEPLSFSLSGLIPFYVLGLGLVTFFGYIFYAEGLKTTKVSDAVIIAALTEPLTAIALAFLILGESVPEYVLIGGTLIIAANVIAGNEHRKKRIEKTKQKAEKEGFGWVW
jgi:drug/metabolite transporter (DMT)-like permease